jgi:hypothetical protein
MKLLIAVLFTLIIILTMMLVGYNIDYYIPEGDEDDLLYGPNTEECKQCLINRQTNPNVNCYIVCNKKLNI